MPIHDDKKTMRLTLAETIGNAYRKSQGQAIDVKIDTFLFQVDPHSGSIRSTHYTEGNIHYGISDRSATSYKYEIEQALGLAVKMELINRLAGLNDPALQLVLKHQGPNLDEAAIQKIFNKLQPIQPVFFGNISLFQTNLSGIQMIIHAVLKNVDLHGMTTFQALEDAWQKILDKLPGLSVPKPD